MIMFQATQQDLVLLKDSEQVCKSRQHRLFTGTRASRAMTRVILLQVYRGRLCPSRAVTSSPPLRATHSHVLTKAYIQTDTKRT